MSKAYGPATHIEPATVDGAERIFHPKPFTAVVWILPSFQRAQHLTGKRFMDFVIIEVLQAQIVALEQTGNCICGRHQQSFGIRPGVFNGGGLRINQPGLRGNSLLRSPIGGGHKNRSGAIGKWRGIPGGQRAAATSLVEGRLELGKFFQWQRG